MAGHEKFTIPGISEEEILKAREEGVRTNTDNEKKIEEEKAVAGRTLKDALNLTKEK